MGGGVVGGLVVVVVVVEVDDVVVEVLVVATGPVVVVEVAGTFVDCGVSAAVPSEELAAQPVRTNAIAAMPQTNLMVLPLSLTTDWCAGTSPP